MLALMNTVMLLLEAEVAQIGAEAVSLRSCPAAAAAAACPPPLLRRRRLWVLIICC